MKRSLAAALLSAALAVAGAAHAAAPRRLDAADVVARLAAGKPVLESNVVVSGDLRLPPVVDAPLVLRNSRLLGRLEGAHRSFSHVVDLSGTELRGPVELSGSRFGAPVVLAKARFARDADFGLAVFDATARFDEADFATRADFSGTEFHGTGSFASATFAEDARFANAEFGSFADFSTAEVSGAARFPGARFATRADFAGASFEGPAVDFSRATFEDGATFLLADASASALFLRATSAGDLSFQDMRLSGGADFSTVRFLGPVSFADAALGGLVSFDQADVAELDLTDADLERLRLPFGPRSGGRIRSLRLDLDDASRIDGPAADDRPAQEAALALVERSARAADDLETANDAKVRRLTIARGRKGSFAEGLDFTVNYGLWGYGVRPFHQLIAIAGVLLAGAGVRWRRRRGDRPTPGTRLRGWIRDLGESTGALLRLRPSEDAWGVAEYLVFKLLVVSFVLNAANVWPVSRDLIEGIF